MLIRRYLTVALLLVFAGIMMPYKGEGQVQTESHLRNKQEEFLKWKFGLFMHFNMGTFVNREWAAGHEDPLLFNPSKLNCEQWAESAKAAGMRYAVLTVKHTGGWCLWNSEHTSHDMEAFKNYKDGKGDILREYVNAFRKHGLKVGIYYCLPGDYSTKYGNREDSRRGYKIEPGQEDLHGLPPEAKGDYQGFIEKQVTELLTKYGKIDEIWFDQYANKYTGKYWQQLKNLVHRLQPECVVVANNSLDYRDTDVWSYEYPYWKNAGKPERALPAEKNTSPGEVCDHISNGWFWNDERELKMQNAADIAELLITCKSRNSNYLLNVPPDKDGLISGEYLETLKELGRIIKKNRILAD